VRDNIDNQESKLLFYSSKPPQPGGFVQENIMDYKIRTLSPQESRVVLGLAEQKQREVSRPEIIGKGYIFTRTRCRLWTACHSRRLRLASHQSSIALRGGRGNVYHDHLDPELLCFLWISWCVAAVQFKRCA
jgi:hypothetical protein